MFTHNIERLIIYGGTLNVNLDVPEYIRKNSLKISDWEAGSRYDVAFSIRIDTLMTAYKVVTEWFDRLS